jgi:hypothetical protein
MGADKKVRNKQSEIFSCSLRFIFKMCFTPAAEGHGLWPWMNAPAFGRDVAPLGREVGATGFARGAPQKVLNTVFLNLVQNLWVARDPETSSG